MTSSVGRNEPCPCGSGKKHKHCCFGKNNPFKSERRNLYGLAAVLILVSILVYMMMPEAEVPTVVQERPPGEAPFGKVWDEAHGHWHDALGSTPTTNSTTTTPATPNQPVPQPAGEVPAGKTWSAEHGHWHDALPGDSL